MWVFFLVVHVLICISMIGLILLQRSEGGGLVSGNPTGLVSARGRADLLTRLTSILATAFFLNSIILAILAGGYNKADKILAPLAETVDVPVAGEGEQSKVDSSPVVMTEEAKKEEKQAPEETVKPEGKHSPRSKKSRHSKK